MHGLLYNASFRDLTMAGAIFKNRKIAKDLSLGVTPGSRQCRQMIMENGSLLHMVNAGARLLESACGFCIGNHFSPKSGGVSLRTSNRNFEGRSGTKDADIYLVSPEIAALGATYGEIKSSGSLDIEYPVIDEPENFLVDDSMFIFPEKNTLQAEVVRGPNIGNPPENKDFPSVIKGEVAIKLGDNITTDHIMPAGPRLKYRSNIEKYAEYVFEHVDGSFSRRSLLNKEKGIHNIIVAEESYGQGSSREHAAICPMYLGVKMVLVKSIERIHAANLVNFGIIPLIFKHPDDFKMIEQGDSLEIKNVGQTLKDSEDFIVTNKNKNIEIKAVCSLSTRQKEILLGGGLLNYTRK